MDAKIKLLLFRVEHQTFSIPISNILRVIQVVEIMHLPKVADYIEGFINVGSLSVPIINFRNLLGYPKKEIELSDQIIILNIDTYTVGLLVDKTIDVEDFDQNQIQAFKQTEIKHEFITAIANKSDESIYINNPAKFFDSNELENLSKLIRAAIKHKQELI